MQLPQDDDRPPSEAGDGSPALGTREQGSRASVAAVHSALRMQILDGTIPAGTALSQVELAERFGVSRTPLREALRMLQEEGLIEARTNRQARVATFALGDLEAIAAQRILLSALATQISVQSLTGQELDEMERLHQAMREASAADDREAWRRADVAFHAAHCAHAPANLYHEVRRLAERNTLYQSVWLRDEPHHDPRTEADHHRILTACRERNAQDAGRAIARHQGRIAIEVLARTAPEHEPRVIRAALQLALCVPAAGY